MSDIDSSIPLLAQCFHATATPLFLLRAMAPDYPVIEANAALEHLLGIRKADLLGQPWWQIFGRSDGSPTLRRLLETAQAGQEITLCERADGETFWGRCVLTPVMPGSPQVTHVMGAVHDITDRVNAEKMRDYFVSHDPVCGLLRRNSFEERLSELLLRTIHQQQRLSVSYIDVDRFSHVNEIYSFRTGDQLLRQIAERLSGLTDEDNLLCRYAGPEFAVAMVDSAGDMDQLDIGQRFLEAFAAPFEVNGMQVALSASVGVSCFPDTAASAQDLIQQASAAARVVRRTGGNAVHAFTAQQRSELADRVRLGPDLRGAVGRKELVLHYQPIVSAVKRRVTGMEALLRWQHPKLGLLAPGRFIRLAEDFGLISEIGQWVLQQACKQARRWLEAGVGQFIISVNVSGLQLSGQRLLEDVSRALNDARLPARCLELEITEDVVMDNVSHVIWLMTELRKIGVSLAMDDFGVGFSSLANLPSFPISRLKIDQSFVAEVSTNISAARVCRAVIGLAHELGHTVVAEGVETPLQLAFLERHGCDFIQGNHFAGPVPAAEMLAILRRPEMLVESVGAASAQATTLLLIDDEQNVVRALSRLLRRDGYQILTAGSFAEALDALATHKIDLILCDQRMPDGKGTDLLGTIKASYPDTIRMILSGYADLASVTEAINGGAVYRFLTKPWDDEELRKVVRDALRRDDIADREIWPDASTD
jgi:diguanylate cyclase (GGDEF)-like protein/PAS domain S-box-containing protein